MHQGRGSVDSADPDRRPIYRKLRELFVQRIRAGEWRPGIAIPNEVHLANQSGVSVGTIRKVMDELSALGIITRLQGKGTFVSEAFRPDEPSMFDPLRNLDGTRITWDPARAEVLLDQASPHEADRLNLEQEKCDVIRLGWLRARDKRVVAWQIAVVPADIGVDPVACRHFRGLSELYARAGILVHKSETMMKLEMPDRDIAQRLQLPEGRPAEWLARRFYDVDQQVVGLCTSWLVLQHEAVAGTQRLIAP